jgi:pantoate--beta-alanine ligase
MDLVRTIEQIRRQVQGSRASGRSVGFVPTMGALHEGHGRLIDEARRETGFVVVSIFVNPLQFGPSEDFARYPRDIEEDLAFCRKRGVDAVFAPDVGELYPQEQKAFVEVPDLTRELCGRFRPGHFKGVTTVVLKLLNIVQPDRVYFGEKDAQQLKAVERMVRDLNVPTLVVPVAIVRESDGLALSSRNRYLSESDRRTAPALYQALQAGLAALDAGAREASAILAAVDRVLGEHPGLRKEYVEVVDAELMAPVASVDGPVRIMAAAWLGKTRLIDNVYWKEE